MAGNSRLQDLTAAFHQRLNDATVAYVFGRADFDDHQQTRRIVWVREGSQLEPPYRAGGTFIDGNPAVRVRICADRIERVAAHIFAEDDEAADTLLDNLIAAVLLTIPAQHRQFPVLSYEWKTHEPREAGHTLRAEYVILHCAFRLPVPDEIKPLRELEDFTDECGSLQQDGSTTEEPTEEPPPPGP